MKTGTRDLANRKGNVHSHDHGQGQSHCGHSRYRWIIFIVMDPLIDTQNPRNLFSKLRILILNITMIRYQYLAREIKEV